MYTRLPATIFRMLLVAMLTVVMLLAACTPDTPAVNVTVNTVTPDNGSTDSGMPSATPTPVTTATLTAVPTAQSPVAEGVPVTFEFVTLVVPPDVADGASYVQQPSVDNDDAAWWQKTPGHLEISFEDTYVLEDTFHHPQVVVYPAQAYAEMAPSAFESIRRVNNILHASNAPVAGEQLPAIPFFNAQQVFASNVQVVAFKNGNGVRFLTEYGQYAAPVNNHELFYNYLGVTNDGAYYIIAIFPVSTPVLAENAESAATPPDGGIVYPNIADPNTDLQGYYSDITNLLNSTADDAFDPAISQLDALISSMQIMP